VGACTALNPVEIENDFELKKDPEERNFHRMAKVHNILEMWQSSQNLHTTQNESRTQNKKMSAVEYISDTQEIITVSWSNFPHDCAAAFESSEWSPLPPATSAQDLPRI